MFKFKFFLFIFFFFAFLFPLSLGAIDDSPAIEATIVKVLEEKEIEVMGTKQLYQRLEAELASPASGKVILENGIEPLANKIKYSVGNRVLLNLVTDTDGQMNYLIVDFVRKDSLLLLSIIFILLLIAITRWRGFTAILGMLFTFFIVFVFILPRLLLGDNPLLIATLASLIITALLASIFTELAHLTGLSSEEAGMLSIDQSNLNMKGILLAGIVIGALGVLDDITISQAAIVDELARTANLTKVKDLYSRSMVIGKDHITSMVNTLVLAYAGASLPLLLIFTHNPHPFLEIINYELIAEEIIRTLIGSIGLILAVPITSLIAANFYKNNNL